MTRIGSSHRYRTASAALIACFLLIGGCADEATPPPISQQQSQALEPSDPTLKDIYNRSCKSCHTIAATGAPLTGDKAAWNQLLRQGMNTMLNNVINGSGGMPPLGLCMSCTPEQFEQLILFMAAADKPS